MCSQKLNLPWLVGLYKERSSKDSRPQMFIDNGDTQLMAHNEEAAAVENGPAHHMVDYCNRLRHEKGSLHVTVKTQHLACAMSTSSECLLFSKMKIVFSYSQI